MSSSGLANSKVLYTSSASSPITCSSIEVFTLSAFLLESVASRYRANLCLNHRQFSAKFPVRHNAGGGDISMLEHNNNILPTQKPRLTPCNVMCEHRFHVCTGMFDIFQVYIGIRQRLFITRVFTIFSVQRHLAITLHEGQGHAANDHCIYDKYIIIYVMKYIYVYHDISLFSTMTFITIIYGNMLLVCIDGVI